MDGHRQIHHRHQARELVHPHRTDSRRDYGGRAGRIAQLHENPMTRAQHHLPACVTIGPRRRVDDHLIQTNAAIATVVRAAVVEGSKIHMACLQTRHGAATMIPMHPREEGTVAHRNSAMHRADALVCQVDRACVSWFNHVCTLLSFDGI